MDYDKYSKAAFDACGLNNEAARKLSDQLQKDVNAELHPVILAAFERIVCGLNGRGHNLCPYGEIRAGDVSFWDQTMHRDCKLRLAYDVVISAGYAHTVTPEQADEQLRKDIAGQGAQT
jgi:hypothetical protein